MCELFKGLCRHDEAHVVVCKRFLTESYAHAVNSDNAEYIVLQLKFAAHESGLAVHRGNGELCLGDHAFQQLLRHCEAGFRVHLGNVGIIVSAHAHNGEIGIPAGDLSDIVSAALKGDVAGWHLSDDISRHSGIDDDIAAFHAVYFNRSLDTYIKVVTGNGEGVPFQFHKNSFKGGNAGFTGSSL